MSQKLTANGLTLTPLQSHPEACSGIAVDELFTHIPTYLTVDSVPHFFVVYLDYRVVIGRYSNSEPLFRDPETEDAVQAKYIQRLRIFNKNEELYLWRCGQTFNGRFRKDGEGESIELIEAEQALFGIRIQFIENGELIELSEDRGTRLVLPFRRNQFEGTPQRLFLKTRNYVGCMKETGQATYIDCRFVSFTDGERELS